ncbi:MAG: hypothetical protein AAF985_23655, partial [Bacteroidota bacterium]
MVPQKIRFLFVRWIGLLLVFLPNVMLGQTTILSNPGMTYTNSDGPTGPDVYTVGVANCSAISFSLDYSFSAPWEGSGNMESADECDIGMMTCPGDPNFPTSGSCDVCWDFLWATFNLDGVEVGGDLIGEAGTTNAEQNGSISSSPICTNGASSADITIVTQTWAVSESVTFSNIMIVCWQGSPSISSGPASCSGGDLPLNGAVGDPAVITSWLWSNSGPGIIANPNAQNTTASGAQSGEIYTLTTTDVNGCMASTSITASLSNAPTANVPTIPQLCSTNATCYDLTQHNASVNSTPGITINWFDGDPNAGGTLLITDFCVNLNTIGSLYVQAFDGNCATSVAVPFSISPPGNPVFNYPSSSCISASNPFPSSLPGSAGTFSVDNGALINPVTGELDLSTTIAGTLYTITFTTTGVCPTSYTQNITVNAGDNTSFVYPTSVCINGLNPAPLVPAATSGIY